MNRMKNGLLVHGTLNMTIYHGIEKDDNSEEAGMLNLVK